MSETLRSNPEYLEHHPDAIQDVEKAYYVANIVKNDEDEAARIRKTVDGEMKDTSSEFLKSWEGSLKISSEKESTEIWDPKDRESSVENQEYKAPILTSTGSGRYLIEGPYRHFRVLNTDRIKEKIDYHNEQSDRRAAAAAKIYDILKESKR